MNESIYFIDFYFIDGLMGTTFQPFFAKKNFFCTHFFFFFSLLPHFQNATRMKNIKVQTSKSQFCGTQARFFRKLLFLVFFSVILRSIPSKGIGRLLPIYRNKKIQISGETIKSLLLFDAILLPFCCVHLFLFCQTFCDIKKAR